MNIDYLSEAVCLNNKVYFSDKCAATLYIYTPATDTRDIIAAPVSRYALTAYNSQLVLVGGQKHDGHRPSAKLWTLSDDGQWQETITPMEKACVSASVVSHGDLLLVIDRYRGEVNVYNGRYWAKAQGLPKQLYNVKSTVYNDNLYVMCRQNVYSASLDSLIASCQPSETSQPSSVWNKLPDVPDSDCYPATFGGRLVTVLVGTSSLYAYDPSSQSWIEVGDIPRSHPFIPVCSTTDLPINELLVISRRDMLKGSLKRKYAR